MSNLNDMVFVHQAHGDAEAEMIKTFLLTYEIEAVVIRADGEPIWGSMRFLDISLLNLN